MSLLFQIFPILTLLGGERGRILGWLSEVTFKEHHDFVRSSRHSGTGGWLLLKENFVDWEDSDSSSLFWLRGNGKKAR